ncbi:MAG: metal-dependent transcriptional regulator [Acholeplasmataceae bacterium]
MHRAEEDYIKTIYELTVQRKQDIVKTNEISDTFGFTDQSVNEMIKKLVAKKLVKFIPYKGVQLTKNGIKEATRLIRFHRIWEVFLTDKLAYAWEDVHEDAERLEHASSETLINKLDELLGYPKYCQHGNPIPDATGHVSTFSSLSIFELEENDTFKIKRVLDHKELLNFLNEHHMHLNKTYVLKLKDVFNGIIIIKDEEQNEVILSHKTSKMIFIEKQ